MNIFNEFKISKGQTTKVRCEPFCEPLKARKILSDIYLRYVVYNIYQGYSRAGIRVDLRRSVYRGLCKEISMYLVCKPHSIR